MGETMTSSSSRFGWLSWRPDCVQVFNTVRWFMAFVCIACFIQAMSVFGLIGVSITSLETRYDLQSSQVAWIPSIIELTGVFVLIVTGIAANFINRVRWIAGSVACISIACLLYTMPHLLSGLYTYDTLSSDNNYCLLDASNRTDYCDDVITDTSPYLAFFYAAAVFFALGSNPLYVFGIAYIDDSTHYTRGAYYIGIFYSMSSLGPAFAYTVGGALLTIYVDVGRVDMDTVTITPSDPRWVGAWWIGFLVGCVSAAVMVIPLLGFPALSPYKKMDPDVIKDAAAGGAAAQSALEADIAAQLSMGEALKHLKSDSKALVTNVPLIFTTLAIIGDGLIVTGFIAFGPKYLENQFSLSADLAGAMFGITVLPGAVGGTILGGWIIKRYKLTTLQIYRGVLVITLITFFFGVIFAIYCDQPPFAGVNIGREGGLADACNAACNCSSEVFDPVCGDDFFTYFSACHAGCLTDNSADAVYGNCSCVGYYGNGSAVGGVCAAPECHLLPLFLILFSLPMFLIFAGFMFHLQCILRVVNVQQRPLALSIDGVVARALGTIPGPLVFGALLDLSCLLWDTDCGQTGSCLYYDSAAMSKYMFLAYTACKGFSAIAYVIAYASCKRRSDVANDHVIKLTPITIAIDNSDVTKARPISDIADDHVIKRQSITIRVNR